MAKIKAKRGLILIKIRGVRMDAAAAGKNTIKLKSIEVAWLVISAILFDRLPAKCSLKYLGEWC